MQIRELDAADRSATIQIWEAAGLTRPWNPPDADFDRATSGATSAVLGGFIVGEPVATVMVGHDGHRGWVYYLAVDLDQRGSGSGRLMMDAAETWLTDRGAVKVQLMVRRTNEQAMGFYEHLDYEDAEVTVMAKWL